MRTLITSFFLVIALVVATAASAVQWRGYVGIEGTRFLSTALSEEQQDGFVALLLEPDLYHRSADSSWSYNFKPFARVDSEDETRTHVDLRELNVGYERGDWVWRFAISKVFWGVTESQHLVDIVNQTDALEGIDGEDKLGQPMVYASVIKSWGTLDLFVLPGFRERRFRSQEDRLRPELVVDDSKATYEHHKGDDHIDYAVRWSQTLGQWDLGLSWFNGTNRDPALLSLESATGEINLVPHYNQIEQFGIDLQTTFESWLLKLEGIHRESDDFNYHAWAGGFEYTFFGLGDSNWDLGVLSEYLYDSRGHYEAMFDDDIMIGFRLTPNNTSSTAFLAGVIYDLDDGANLFNLEFESRIGDSWKLEIELRLFENLLPDEPQYAIRQDDHALASFSYYF